jgi:hypothetical protein
MVDGQIARVEVLNCDQARDCLVNASGNSLVPRSSLSHMGIYLDEPLAAVAATALAVTGAALGAWWQRRRRPPPQRVVPGDIDRQLMDARFDRLEQLAEQTALEVERVAEGQRFTTKLLAERMAPNVLPAGSPGRPAEHRTPH